MKSATTASTAIPHPAIAIPVCPVGTNTEGQAAGSCLALELQCDGHFPDGAIGADGEHKRRPHRARDWPRSERSRPLRGPPQVVQAPPRAHRRLRRARGRHRGTRAGRSRRPAPDARMRAPAPATPTGSGRQLLPHPRSPASARSTASRRRQAVGTHPPFPRARRVEDGDHVLTAIAEDAPHRLSRERIARRTLGEEQQPCGDWPTPRPGASLGVWTPSTKTPNARATGHRRGAGCRRGRRNRRGATAAARRDPRPDSCMQPTMTPDRTRGRVGNPTAPRIPPDFASLTLARGHARHRRRCRRACGSPRRRRSAAASEPQSVPPGSPAGSGCSQYSTPSRASSGRPRAPPRATTTVHVYLQREVRHRPHGAHALDVEPVAAAELQLQPPERAPPSPRGGPCRPDRRATPSTRSAARCAADPSSRQTGTPEQLPLQVVQRPVKRGLRGVLARHARPVARRSPRARTGRRRAAAGAPRRNASARRRRLVVAIDRRRLAVSGRALVRDPDVNASASSAAPRR